MPRHTLLALSLLICGPLVAQTIPTIHAQSFAGKEVTLPSDLSGRVGVLVVGFSKKSSMETKSWNDPILGDYGSDPRIAYYQMPMLAEVPTMVRGLVLQGMRKQMSPQDQMHLVPILQDGAEWKSAMRFDAPDDAYVVALDSGGRVKWRTHGRMTAQAYGQLKACVVALKSSPSASCN